MRPRRLALVLGLLALLGCGTEHADDVVDVDAAERIHVALTALPAPDDRRWRSVSLPDWWGVAARRRSLAGWYRTTVRLATAPDEPWAVYLPRIGQHVSLWANRALIGTSGPLGPPLPRNWNRPQLFALPAVLLHPGENELLIRLVTHPGAPGFLRNFQVGPMRELGPMYERRLWRQVTLGQIVGSATLGAGLLLLAFALREKRFHPHRLLALGLILWSWTSADAFFRTIPVPSRWWEASTSAALVWSVVCFTLGFHRLLGLERRRTERIVLGVAASYTLALCLASAFYAFALTVAGGGIAVVLALYLLLMLARHPDLSGVSRRALLLPAGVGAFFGIHDLLLVGIGHSPFGTLLSPYIPVVAIGATGWLLLERHVASMRETEALNAELEARVTSKHRELEANYERLRALERRDVVAAERERILQDMHDGMGGQLVSTLAMVESGGWTAEQVGEALRDALDDLRLVIDSLDPGEQDLLTVLGMVRGRLEPRLARHGLRFRWRVVEVPPVRGFGPEMALQVMRIVQEAITNVVKHAGATGITIRTGEALADGARAGVFVEIEDDGCGVAARPAAGRGLAGMRRRAARLGGTIDIEPTEAGTRVRLWLPRDGGAT